MRYVMLVSFVLLGCKTPPPSGPPDETMLRSALVQRLACARPNVESISTAQVSGLEATSSARARCTRVGAPLNDFGRSCQNLLGCCEAWTELMECDLHAKWNGRTWLVDPPACRTSVEKRGSVAAGYPGCRGQF